MKKSLLLSVVATGVIFAGGNIAPAAPVVQPSVAPAACDFYGSIGARYEAYSDLAGNDLFNKDLNKAYIALVLGVEKDLGNGFGIGAELGAFKASNTLGKALKGEKAELSQLFVTYKTGNTTIKAGRQALPKSLSPWAWTDTTLGVKDTTFEGVVVVNTDVKDTTLVGAWIAKVGSGSEFGFVNGENNKGLFAATAQYKGIADTTLTGSVYYITKPVKATVVWTSAETKANNVDLGLQAVYAKVSGAKSTSAVAAYAGTTFGDVTAKLTAAYIKGGDVSLAPTGTSAFWGNSFAAFGGDTDGGKQKIVRLDLGYKLPMGKLYGGVAYDKNSGGSFDKMLGARVGYDFKVSNVNAKVEYRFVKATVAGTTSPKQHRVRVQGVYKF